MMTSRAEYRLLLRQDNADLRLTEQARRTGLISEARYARLMQKREGIEQAVKALSAFAPPSEALAALLDAHGEPVPKTGVRLFDLLKRAGIGYKMCIRDSCGADASFHVHVKAPFFRGMSWGPLRL